MKNCAWCGFRVHWWHLGVVKRLKLRFHMECFRKWCAEKYEVREEPPMFVKKEVNL